MADENTELQPVFGGALVDVDDERFVSAMEDTVDDGARGGDISYMSFSGKKGKYKIGVDGREPEADEMFLVAATAFESGWICWKGGKPVAKRMAKLGQPKIMEPDPDEFGPFDDDRDGWSRCRAITMKSLNQEEQCYFSVNSKSANSVIADLQRQVLDRYKAGQPFWPVITLSSEEFTAQGNTNDKPVFNIETWCTTDQVNTLADPEVDPLSLIAEKEAKTPAPKPRRRL